jgi:hypothetical protein
MTSLTRSQLSTARAVATTPADPRFAPVLALAGAVTFLMLVAALHVLKPEFEASWRFLSEYANGRHGWVMGVAFLSLAVGCASLAAAIRSEVRGRAGRVGVGFLLAAVIGLTMAAVFPMDPITIDPAEATFNGNMHAIASIIGIPSLPVAAALVSLDLARQPDWSGVRRRLLWSAGLTWVGLLVMIGAVAILLPLHGGFGPDVLIGWPNRLLMLTYVAWVMTVSWLAAGRESASINAGSAAFP